MERNKRQGMTRREFLGSSAAVWGVLQASRAEAAAGFPGSNGRPLQAGEEATRAKARHTFDWKDEQFLLDGKPFQIISGSMHYPRVPRACWRDRMRKLRAMGLNTLCTYCFWDLHEPERGRFDFTGNLDVASYIRMAQEEGLWVLLRPGPYICSEWDFGGLPAWLLRAPNVKVRTTDPKFLKPAGEYLGRLGREVAGLQITQGGPIIMVQVENEYGSFGNDHAYMRTIRRLLRDAGLQVTLYTSDGSAAHELEGGTLPGVLSSINFGAGDALREFANFAKFRQGVPRMCGEYWVGWFDHWGEQHHEVPFDVGVKGLDWMLAQGISVNLYMAHGGTSFGFMSGANFDKAYQPDISSYDYDSPLDEAGRPTEKFFAFRETIKKYLPAGSQLPRLPTPVAELAIPRFGLGESAALADLLGKPVRAERPQTMEQLGQSFGFVLYRKNIARAGKGKLEINEARDYAVILQGGKRLGTLDRRLGQKSLQVELAAGQPLEILVENLGRTNFGPRMVDDRKGIVGFASWNGQELTGWEQYTLPMDNLERLKFSSGAKDAPAFYRGTLNLASVGDTFLDMRGWGKGYVWVNGHNLGRYWKIGPQQTLYVPAVWLQAGANTVIVLDLGPGGERSIEGLKDSVWETPGNN